MTPLGQGGGIVLIEDIAAIEVTVLIEMIVIEARTAADAAPINSEIAATIQSVPDGVLPRGRRAKGKGGKGKRRRAFRPRA